MICCEDGQNYAPHGREVMNSHPNRPNSCANFQEWWTVVDHNGREEELYVCHQTAVWSRGQPETNFQNAAGGDDSSCDAGCGRGRSVVCTFTVESKIKQALFTTFYTYPDQPAMLGEHVLDHPTGTPLYSLCILEQEYLNVYTETGEEFSIALPFAVEKIWSIWYGLLLQRKVSASEPDPPHPLLFSLLHPLEEISPINQKIGK
ncbi:Anaphase-promoting complex subunit 1 [Trinorchestia longiramus]|nr:Anaphase-promoting complex subunit 1 [Trinorchestia longiramus]